MDYGLHDHGTYGELKFAENSLQNGSALHSLEGGNGILFEHKSHPLTKASKVSFHIELSIGNIHQNHRVLLAVSLKKHVFSEFIVLFPGLRSFPAIRCTPIHLLCNPIFGALAEFAEAYFRRHAIVGVITCRYWHPPTSTYSNDLLSFSKANL